jgi:tetratricopeptide (TPR) repeat protein
MLYKRTCHISGRATLTHHSLASTVVRLAVAAILALGADMAIAQTAPAPTAAAKAKPAAKAGPSAEGGEQSQDAAKKDPNQAQAHVDNGIKLLQGGKIDAAVHTFSSVIGAGKLPPTIMARALYNRGLGYRKQGKPAQAISDLTSALWMKGGLNDAERADALASRVAAYREAGLADQSTGEDSTAAADNKVSATRSKTADQVNSRPITTQSIGSGGTTAALAPEPASNPSSSGGVGGLFGNLFGGGSSTQAPAEAKPAPAPQPVTASTVQSVTVAKAAVPVDSAPAAAKPVKIATATAALAASPAAPKSDGVAKFRAQIALVRTRAEADAAAQKMKDKYKASLGTSELVIDQTTLGNMGSFYRVRIGPYLSQIEAQAVCASLNGSGLDCVPVTQ